MVNKKQLKKPEKEPDLLQKIRPAIQSGNFRDVTPATERALEREEKVFIDTGFGFPLILLNVPMIKIRDIWTPNIDYIKLTNIVLKSLVTKPSRLTGNEIRFIRLTFEMTLKEFAERFYVTHPCVINWEKEKDNPTGMNWITEKDIRLFIFDKLTKEEDLRPVYEKLEKEPIAFSDKKLEFDIKNLELAYAS